MVFQCPTVENLDEIQEIDINKRIFEQNYTLEKYSDDSVGFANCIKIETMEQFYYVCQKIFALEQRRPTIYRGQSNYHWKLTSSLEREIINNIPIDRITTEIYDKIREEHLTNFKKLARGKLKDQSLLKGNTSEYDNELWAIAQHLKMKTPLIDWSKSFFVGVFFAFNSQEECEYRAVYRILSEFINKLSQNIVIEPKMDYYGRLTAQQGVFTYWGMESDLEKICNVIDENVNKEIEGSKPLSKQVKEKMLTKYYISNSLKKDIQKYLEHIGITYETIYPDLDGIIEKVNLDLLSSFEKYKR